MSKNISLVLNIVLVVAVAILFYFHFSCTQSCQAPSANDSTVAAKPVVMMPKEIKSSKIVYINSDILNEKYEFVKDLTVSAQARQQRLDAAYQIKGQKLQQDYADFQDKMNSKLLSENQAAAAQEDLMKKKAELDQMEGQLQQLVDETQKSNEEVRKTVTDYVREYNKNGKYDYILTYTDGPGGIVLLANDSLDITDEIVEGLNAQYREKKNSKKSK